jgi:hypothetical protein
MKGDAPAASINAPTQNSAMEVELGAVTGHKGGEYGSRLMLMHVKADGDAGLVAHALEWWVCEQGFPGMIFNAGNGAISILWAKSLGYDPVKVHTALEMVKASVVHAQAG